MTNNNVIQIDGIRLPALTNDAHFLYMRDLVIIMEEDAAVKATPNVKTAVAELKAAVDEEDKYVMLSRKNAITAKIVAKDNERDSVFRGYHTAVKAALRFPAENMAKAAAELWEHLKVYSIDPEMQLERETSRIMNLVDDLNSKFSAQVTLLNLKPYVDALEAANDAVNELTLTRTEEFSKEDAGALRRARLGTDEAYQKAIRLINAIVVVGTDKDFVPLIRNLNENIKRYKEQVMTRPKKQDGGKKPGKKPSDPGKNPSEPGKKPNDPGKKPDEPDRETE